VVEYLKALDALQRDDRAAFKKHITEAFWLSPRQGPAFARHIERMRLDRAMEEVQVDLTRPLDALDGERRSLNRVLGDDKALLLHFWSPWDHQAELALPETLALAGTLERLGLATVTVLVDRDDEARAATREALAAAEGDPPGAWLLDHAREPLQRTLRVRELPTVVVVAPDGRVLFNGAPGDPTLWRRLAKYDPAIRPPDRE